MSKIVAPTEDLGLIKNVEVVKRFVDLNNKTVVDAGCGNLTFSNILAELGADVVAIDPDPVQAEKNRDADLPDNIQFFETGANQLPVNDQSTDGVFFSYSLHHVPAAIYPEVFTEVRRVLKPDGFLYILEPIDCPLNQVMKLFHDEEKDREAAQIAITELAVPHFQSVRAVTYHDIRQFASFDDFAVNYSSKSFNSLYTEADVRHPDVKTAFEHHGAPDYKFTSPKKVVVLERLK